MKPKVMFINAIDPIKEIEVCFSPLGLGYLISSLRKEFGHDSIKFKIINQSIEQEINSFRPDLICITSVTQNYGKAVKYARIAKKYNLPVIVGGVHISMLPSSLTNDMDVGVIGEGEETIIDLFNLFIDTGGLYDKNKLRKINGIAFKDNDNGKLILTKRRKLIEPLDKIPLPARDLFETHSHAYMFTSRGCPYRCVFCASSRFWDKVRFFSAEYVVNEIKHLVKRYNVKSIGFWDDLFILDKKRIERILELLKKEGLLGKISFGCSARADLINDKIVLLLKKMNIRNISMGLESGCPKTLGYLKADTLTIKESMNAIRTIKKHGIVCGASFIIGSPKETEEDILSTLKFIKESKLDGFDVYVLTPFPGTPVWEYAKERNLVSEDMNWKILNIRFAENYKKAVILSEKLTREKLVELFSQFQKESKRRKIRYLIKAGLKNPFRAPRFLIERLKWKILSLKRSRGDKR